MKRALVGLVLLLASSAVLANSGETVYQQNCAGCHNAAGTGTPGFAPGFKTTLPPLLQAETGRAYLANVILWGLQGQLTVNGQTFNGAMPPFSQLSDADIAEVLNYILTAWDNKNLLPDGFTPYTPEEIAKLRSTTLTPQDVLKLRPTP